jgi:RNA polymerase sigma factor (sigma-70 family)
MEPVTSPLEPVDIATQRRDSAAELAILAAWSDHHDELYAFLVRATRDPDTAEDLLSEAFLRLTREVRAGRTPDNVRAWLYRVAANLATSRGRRIAASLRGLVRIGAASATRTDDPPEASLLAHEGRSELVAALGGLKPDARTALLLSAEGFSGPEIAAAIGRSEAATRTLLCRTRLSVRSRLESREAQP